MAADKDLAAHLAAVREDIQSLSDTVSRLVSDTAGIQATLKRQAKHAARQAASMGEEILHEATHLGEEAIHAATRGANAAVHKVEKEIERNPIVAVLIALGAGLAVGLFTRK